jgi:hypothetical protein
MTIKLTESSQFLDVFSESEIDQALSIIKTARKTNTQPRNYAQKIIRGSSQFDMLHNLLFLKFKKIVGDNDLILGSCSFLEIGTSYGIHADPDFVNEHDDDQVPHMTMLIPVSVDNDKKLVENANTVIYDKFVVDYGKEYGKIHDQLTVHKIHNWKFGSVICWPCLQLHDTDNFFSKGFRSKQAIQFCTYKNKNVV